MLIVKHGDSYFGPFTPLEIGFFTSALEGEYHEIPLVVPSPPDEAKGPLQVRLMGEVETAQRRDGVKVDAALSLKAIMWEFHYARAQERVLTAKEILAIWDILYRVCRTLESLMFHAEAAVADPSTKNLEALRKAIWRNRDADDVDEHYADRFW